VLGVPEQGLRLSGAHTGAREQLYVEGE